LLETGPNAIAGSGARTVPSIILGALKEPMLLLLLAAAALYLVLGDLGEGLFMLAGTGVAVGLVVIQEARSERALAALRTLAQPYAQVVRDGVTTRVPADRLAPGDILLVAEGDRLSADGMLLGGDLLTVDESALTGESAPVVKQPNPRDGVGNARNDGSIAQIFAGTLVLTGHGVAEVTLTGDRTALGRIGVSLASIKDEQTPLQKTAARLVGYLGVAALAFCALVSVTYGLIEDDWTGGVLAGLTVAIALIPEEFPMVLTVFLALGAWRLANHKVIVRRAAAIESLGAASVLCVDKTGTLTENRMRLAWLWPEGTSRALDAASPAPQTLDLLRAASLASARLSADPMDRAILAIQPLGRDEPQKVFPLSKSRLAVIQVWRSAEGQFAAAKGAPEAIFSLCRLSETQTAPYRKALEDLASRGFRVLAAASWNGGGRFPDAPEAAHFEFAGLLAFVDPLRKDARAALDEARGAGIAVAMITGDYPATALAIAREAGIDVAAGVLLGREIAGLSLRDLQTRLIATRVFARVQPDQKLRIVEAFKANGEVVAMTGDGVNDAPALEAAHIGVAMGARGTDVAREAADLVLLDDSFASIVGGVRLGRRIFANLRKALTYITAVHVPIAGLAIIPLLAGLPPLFFPVHVVLLELIVDPVCSLVFEAEPSDEGAMSRPPRNPKEALFGPKEISFAILQGSVIMTAVLGIYAWALTLEGEAESRGAAFATLVVANLVLALSDSASSRLSLFHPHRRVFWAIALAALALVCAALFSPVLQPLFHIAPPDRTLLGASVLVGVFAGGWFRALNMLRRRDHVRSARETALGAHG